MEEVVRSQGAIIIFLWKTGEKTSEIDHCRKSFTLTYFYVLSLLISSLIALSCNFIDTGSLL